jgi:hypothetical protein
MSEPIVSFPRPFQVWLYSVSHGQLLLRSNRSESLTARVDVLFRDVAAIGLPTIFEGLSVVETSADQVRDLYIHLGSLPLQHRKVFVIRGTNFTGHVVAGAIFWHEDAGYHFDESYFENSLRIPRGI